MFPAEDGNYYCFNKGMTETSVTVSSKVASLGDSVLIEGTVLDMSPAQPGTPAVADEDMTEWMDYLHLQNATTFTEMEGQTTEPGLIFNPPTPNGVSVRLWTVDPNGNTVDIGTVTSDSSGLFKMGWEPEIEGEYAVYASFDGSGSYWSSQDSTALLVGPKQMTNTGGEQPAVEADNTGLLYGILVAVVVAIIIGIIAIVLVLRKR